MLGSFVEKINAKLENFSSKYQALYFITILYATIVVFRVAVWIKDVEIMLCGYELHHFYFGVAGLIIVAIYAFFARKTKLNRFLTLTFLGISIGTVCDEFLFILLKLDDLEYGTTLLSTIVLVSVVVLITLIIKEYVKDKRN